jgi:hypothetical protein
MRALEYHFRVHLDPSGLWAECMELEGCIARSDKGTIEDLKLNSEDVLNTYLDKPQIDSLFPLPYCNLDGEDIFKVPVKPYIAFAMMRDIYFP